MNNSEFLNRRLFNQQITGTDLKTIPDLLSWMVAMQSQEYAQARWSIGMRLPGFNDSDIEKAFNNGEILRTHLMRPTWHFVSPADIRWLLNLTAHRVHAFNATMYRKMGLDEKFLKRCNSILEKTLEGNNYSTRDELRKVLKGKKIHAEGVALGIIMMHAELDGIICSGPRKGNQFTYALLDEKAAPAKTFIRDEALPLFVERYFNSRGPATIKDFVWWSGLTVREARTGFEDVRSKFCTEIIDGQEYIFPDHPVVKMNKNATFLMMDYDEYGISYKDRSMLRHPGTKSQAERYRKGLAYHHLLVIDGQISGIWEKEIKEGKQQVVATPFIPLTKASQHAVDRAVARYVSFLK